MRALSLTLSGLLLLAAPLTGPAQDAPAAAGEAVPETVSQERLGAESEGTPAPESQSEVLRDLQGRYGPYDPAFGEALVGVAMSYREAGRHAEAVELLERAVHVKRVNEGLHSPGQVDLLNLLIDTQTEAEDWSGLNQSYMYLYWLVRRNKDLASPELIANLYRIGKWHVRAYALDTGEIPGAHLRHAAAAFETAAELQARRYGENSAELVDPLLGLALVQLRLASYAETADSREELRFATSPTRAFMHEEMERQEAILSSYRKGRDALRKVVEIHKTHAELGAADTARAMTYLGDWYLLFNRRQSAADAYQEAYALARDAGVDEEQMAALFERPNILPALRFAHEYGGSPEADDIENPDTVTASFDVSASGKVRNIRILEVKGEDARALERSAKRQLARARFRPRMQDGEPVATDGMKLRYVFEN